MSSGVLNSATGSVEGTGAAIDIVCGFRPGHVKLVNRGGLVLAEWFAPMPNASAAKTVTNGTTSFITSNGITPAATGFRIGADTDINVDGELIYWKADELPRQG